MKLSIEHVLNLVDALTRNKQYDYVSGGENKAKLIGVNKLEKCIELVRVNADLTEKTSNMTRDTLEKLCSKVFANKPFKFDSVLDGGGNARSTFEAIFAHTTEFYVCKVGKVKHLIWVPQFPHPIEKIYDFETIRSQFDDMTTSMGASNLNLQYRPYLTAIKSKPFLLLAGISGTGKSRIVRELARACWDVDSDEYKAQKPRNFEMVQVKPNWHDSSELIGYVSRIDGVRYVVGPFLRFMVKAIKDPSTPYFLCLDEMNLAPVEQYFAEYLSVVESRKRQDDGSITTDPIVDYSNTEEYHSLISQLFDNDEERMEYLKEDGGKRLSIPQNLIVVGTVNMDETTFSFSRKVLDRAMTIEMNEVDLYGGLNERHEQIGKLGAAELIGDAVEGVDVYAAHKDVCDIAINYLLKINDKLEGTPFKIAYRTRNEVLLYVVNNLPYNKDEDGKELEQGLVVARALDEITSMKILSRIEGDEAKVSKRFLEDLQATIKEGLESVNEGVFENSVSLAKLSEMKKCLESGYTSFWS